MSGFLATLMLGALGALAWFALDRFSRRHRSGDRTRMPAPLIQPYQGALQFAPGLPQTTVQSPFEFWCKPVYTASDGTLYCPGIEGNTYMMNPWDYVQIPGAVAFGPGGGGPASDKTPGLAEITITKGRDIDRKRTKGTDGTRVTLYGLNAAEGTLTLTIWTPEQLRQLNLLWPILSPPAGKGISYPFDVHHPKLITHDVKSVQFYHGEGPDIDREHRARFTIRWVEFLPPKAKTATSTPTKPLGSIADSTVPASPNTPGTNSATTGP